MMTLDTFLSMSDDQIAARLAARELELRNRLAGLEPKLAERTHDELRADAVDEALIQYAAELQEELDFLTENPADYLDEYGWETYDWTHVDPHDITCQMSMAAQ